MDCYIERDGPAICNSNHHLVYGTLNRLLEKHIPQALREVTKQEGALMCFDEVMTGFRIAKVRWSLSLI